MRGGQGRVGVERWGGVLRGGEVGRGGGKGLRVRKGRGEGYGVEAVVDVSRTESAGIIIRKAGCKGKGTGGGRLSRTVLPSLLWDRPEVRGKFFRNSSPRKLLTP